MKVEKPVFKLEHPSKGTRKDSILTDEMLVAFCESRIDWLKEDIEDAHKEANEFHKRTERRVEMFIRSCPELVASPYELAGFNLPFENHWRYRGAAFSIKYQSPTFYLNFHNQEYNNHWRKGRINITFEFSETQWENGLHTMDPHKAIIDYQSECTMEEIQHWIDLRDWTFNSEEFFTSYIAACEGEELEYMEQMNVLIQRIEQNREEINHLRWKKALAAKRALQSRALDIIEFGYEGEEQKLFKKVDRPMMVKRIEILRITPSKKSVDVRIVGRDFVKYEYGYYGIWRTGTVYTEEKEWISKNVRIATLFEMDIVQDYSEEKCAYDPTVEYRT